jgi:hypothetical protein
MHGYTLLGRCWRLAGVCNYLANNAPFGLQASAQNCPVKQERALASVPTWADFLQKLWQNVQPAKGQHCRARNAANLASIEQLSSLDSSLDFRYADDRDRAEIFRKAILNE